VIRRKKTQGTVSFQMTPMIDMTFLLLIFFMVTSKLSSEQLKMTIDLPTASVARIPKNVENRDVINIDSEGRYFIGENLADKKQMAAYLKKRFKNAPPLQIYLRADKNTPSKKIKEFMQMASEAGAVNVIFATYQN